MDRRPSWLLSLILIVAAGTLQAAEVRIHHAEEFALSAEHLPTTQALGKPGARVRAPVPLRAFGKTFALELEDNTGLLASLPAARQAEIAGRVQLYGGRLQGQANSWLRLTRIGKDLHGLIFDGNEFYSISPRRVVEASLDPGAAPATTETTNLIYRAMDMDVDFGGNFCSAVRANNPGLRGTGDVAFSAILGEITSKTSAASLATREIEVGLLGDLQFFRRQGTSSEDALIARFNVVDGIFSEQADLRITVGYLKVFTGSGNPFTTNDSHDLLTEVSEYRESSATLQAFGLTHLVTGRPLNGNTVGVGFIEGVCDPYYGTSLSEDMGFDVTLSGLIAAHELGHNFGAEHDAEVRSPCQSTPDGYLMAPSINYSGTFSDCSLRSMSPVIEGAPCVFSARISDTEIRGIQIPADATMRAPVALIIPVRSSGNSQVDDVKLTVDFKYPWHPLSIKSATASDATCNIKNLRVTCSLGSIPPATVRKVRIVARSEFVNEADVTALLTASNDMRSLNNRQYARLSLAPRVDVAIFGNEEFPVGVVAAASTSTFTVSATGFAASQKTTFSGDFGSSTIQSVTASSGTCSTAGNVPFCNLGAIPIGGQRTVTVTHVPTTAGDFRYQVWANALYDDVPNNETYVFYPYIRPRHALELWGENDDWATVGESTTLRTYIRTVGSMPLENTTVTLEFPAGLDAYSVTTEAGPCNATPVGGSWICFLPTLGAETTSPIEFVTRANAPGTYIIRVTASSPNNDYRNEPGITLYVRAWHANDMEMRSAGSTTGFDHRDTYFYVHAISNGTRDEKNVRVKVTLAPTVAIRSASTDRGTCTFSGSSANCTIGTIPGGGHSASIVLAASAPSVGTYEGTASVSSMNDAVAGNNQTTFRLDILPNIDVRVKSTASRSVTAGKKFRIPVQIRTATQPVTDIRFEIQSRRYIISLDSVELVGGSCRTDEWRAQCTIAGLPARSAVTAYVNAHTTEPGSDELFFRVAAPGDVEGQNDTASMSVTVQPAPTP